MNSNKPQFENAFTQPDPKDDYVVETPPPKKPRFSRKWKIIIISISVFVFIFAVLPGFIYLRASNSNPAIPYEDFERINQFQLETEIANNIIRPEANVEELTLPQSLLNRYIYSFIQTNVNQMYDPNSSCELNQCQYLYHELNDADEILIGVKAMWVEIENDAVFINLAIDYDDLIDISTVARFEANIKFNIDRINLEIVDFKLDNYNVPNFVLNQIRNSLEENLVLELPPSFDAYVDVDLTSLSASLRQADVRYVLDTGPARIESIQVVDGGIIFVIRYIN